MIRSLAALALVLSFAIFAPSRAPAQEPVPDVPLEQFVQRVASLWLAGDVATLVELVPAENRILLDTGTGMEVANSRHAAAALRELFAERETIATRALTATVAAAAPPRGFGELLWTFRARGVPAEQSRSIYVAARWEDRGWRISELRILP